MAKTLEQQLACAMQRARTAKIVLVCIGFDERGFRAEVTSERDRSTIYTITRDPQTHDLACTCPATVVCKHIGACLNEGTSYHSNAIPASALPVTPNPNRPDPEPELPAPSVAPTFAERQAAANAAHGAMLRAKYGRAPADLVAIIDDDPPVLSILVEQQREDAARAVRFAPKLISREEAIADFPMLMDIEAEVARIEAEMDLAGFCWSEAARTWVRKPTIAARAAAALPADRTPETFSVFAEVAR